MGYNQGLAVGLAVGIPCLIVLLGVVFFVRRNRRLQRKEDQAAHALDFDIGDNGLFKEFGEALHRPAHPPPAPRPGSPLHSASSQTRSLLEQRKHSSPGSSAAGSGHSGPKAPAAAPPPALPSRNSSLAYAFYDTVIPIMPPATPPDAAWAQPPAVGAGAAADRLSLASSRGSLLGDTLSRSLETLARQLQGPLLFDKAPLRASAPLAPGRAPPPPPRAAPHAPPRGSSTPELVDLYGGVNDHFVDERVYAALTGPEGPRLLHPYRERVTGSRGSDAAASLALDDGRDEGSGDGPILREQGRVLQ